MINITVFILLLSIIFLIEYILHPKKIYAYIAVVFLVVSVFMIYLKY
jgi:hypothetical protein